MIWWLVVWFACAAGLVVLFCAAARVMGGDEGRSDG